MTAKQHYDDMMVNSGSVKMPTCLKYLGNNCERGKTKVKWKVFGLDIAPVWKFTNCDPSCISQNPCCNCIRVRSGNFTKMECGC